MRRSSSLYAPESSGAAPTRVAHTTTTAVCRRRALLATGLLVALAALLAPSGLLAAPSLEVYELDPGPGLGAPLTDFEYLVNEDNSGDPADPDPEKHPSLQPTPSFSPIVAMGDETTAGSIALRDGRYLVTVRAEGYKMWGQHFTLGSGPDPVIQVELIPHDLPLADLNVSVFQDNAAVNAAPDIPGTGQGELGADETGMAGFHIVVEDRVGQVVVDYWGNPLCTEYDGDPGGEFPPGNIAATPGCYTNAAGELTIHNLPPGGYSVVAIPPDGSGWIQTTTFEGKHDIDFVNLTENDDGFGALNEALLGPLTLPTAFWYGFVKKCTFGDAADTCPTNDTAGTATVTGRARNLIKWPPGAVNVVLGEPVVKPWIALSNNGGGGEQVYTARGNADGTFTIPNVPAGEYQLSIWDDPLDYLMRFAIFTVGPGETLDLGDIGVFRWFGWVSGHVFKDNGLTKLGDPIPGGAADNGIRDCVDPVAQLDCEEGIPGTDLDIRFRDGSVKSATFTNQNGYYEFAEELSKIFKFGILEVGFGRFHRTGHSILGELRLNNPDGNHDGDGLTNANDPDLAGATVIPQDLGGGLLLNQKTSESWRSEVDFGKRAYPADDPATAYDADDLSTWGQYEGSNGGITGIAFNAITRNELDARLQANEDYEAGIPNTTTRLWGLGADGDPNTADDVLLNELQTDLWSHPRADHPDLPQSCDIRDQFGTFLPSPTLVPGTTLDAIERCMEISMNSNETKAGAFDGGYAFEEACETGILAGGDADGDTIPNEDDTDLFDQSSWTCGATPLVPQDYVVQAVTPEFMQVVREEDVNVNDGDSYAPQIPPPPCAGDLHVVDVLGVAPDGPDAVYNPTFAAGTLYDPDGGSPFEGQEKPFCDKRLVTLQDQQNPAADFFFFPNHILPGGDEADAIEAPTAGRIAGLVTDDTHFESDPTNPLFGEPRPLKDIPIGIRDYTGRLITTVLTDEFGSYEAILPSSYTANCPNPGGYCPGMYNFIIDDPGDPSAPNPTFNPNYLVEGLTFDVWPGKTTLLDTPLDAIAGVSCDPSGTAGNPLVEPFTPLAEFFSVSQPYGNAGDTITIKGDFFVETQGSGKVTLDGVTVPVVASPAEPGSPGNPAGYPADPDGWADNRITFQIPALSASFLPGPKQLLITNDNGSTTMNAITIHVLGTFGATAYNPPLVHVNPDATIGATPIQDAIDAAGAGDLIVVHPGTYRENVILHKKVRLQGYGPGGQAGTRFQLSPPDDVRRLVEGTSIDGRFFNFPANIAAWDATLAGAMPFGAAPGDTPGPAGVLRGAVITVVADTSEFTDAFNARIDGFHVTLGRGTGAGGIQVHAFARFLEISNNILEGNGGEIGGGIGLGKVLVGDNQNDDVQVRNNRIMGSGGRKLAGGVGIFTGAERYSIRGNLLCANDSSEYGGGVSHFGLSPNGVIEDNIIHMNSAFDEGGGIFIGGEPPTSPGPLALSAGTGTVDVDRNLIHSNVSQDDGGGIMVLDALAARINIRNNILVNNVSGDFGTIVLDDSSNVAIVNNTIPYNFSTGTSEDRDTSCGLNAPFLSCPHGAGLVSHANSSAFNNLLYGTTTPACATVDCFSNPILFNNIFWANEALTWNPNRLDEDGNPAPALESNGCMDFDIFGATPTPDPTLQFSPTYSTLSNEYPVGGPVHPTNIVGPDCPAVGTIVPAAEAVDAPNFPQFVSVNEVAFEDAGPVGGDPTQIFVSFLRTDPAPLGHDGLPGDYHVLPGSPAIDTGTGGLVTTSLTPANGSRTIDGAGNAAVFPTCAGGLLNTIAGNLSAIDLLVCSVRSNPTGGGPAAVKTSSWFITFPGVPNDASGLRVTYSGTNHLMTIFGVPNFFVTTPCNQFVEIFNFTTATWAVLDNQVTGAATIGPVAPSGTLSDFVSGTSGPGNVQVRVRCTRTGNTAHASVANWLKLDYDVGYQAPNIDIDHEPRPMGVTWEIGADEVPAVLALVSDLSSLAQPEPADDAPAPAPPADDGPEPDFRSPQAYGLTATVKKMKAGASRVVFRVKAKNCAPCRAVLKIKIKRRWHSHTMKETKRGFELVLRNVPRGTWRYYAALKDLDSGRKATSAHRVVTVR